MHEQITNTIIKSIMNVHNEPGPEYPEKIYHNALLIELRLNGLRCQTEKKVSIVYKNKPVGTYQLDILVENQIIVELKTVSMLAKFHYSQVRSYLKATGLKVGILVNFSLSKADFRRIEIN